MNPNAFRNLSYGVYLISTLDGSRPTGCIANSVMQITSEPATLALSMNHNNFTNSCIEKSGLFAVSVLAETSNPNLIAGFGFRSGKDVDKFEHVEYQTIEGLPVVTDSCAYVICKVVNKMETATHTVFLGEVIDCDVLKNAPAMTYAYYHKVVKGSSPKNAPTYLPPETEAANSAESAGTSNASASSEGEAKYVCSVCGYVYDGDTPFEELPDSYTCPVCGQPKSVFRKQ